MNINITIGSEFKRQFKQLAKKYHSLTDDFIVFQNALRENPLQGDDLGNGVRKVRMTITSKSKGKSGGARVLTLNVWVEDNANITLLTIYDKSEISNVSDQYIRWLVSQHKS